ncbi:MAG: hypothetical protein ACOZBG_02895 [Candidatus Micrarchaeota archaeon]
MRLLTFEEAKRLIHKPLEGTQITFSDEAVKKIFEFCGGRPMEIYLFCSALMEKFSKDRICKSLYSSEDIDRLTKKEIFQLEESFHLVILNYQRIYDYAMSDEERAIINSLIKAGKIPVSYISPDLIQSLIDTGLVIKGDDNNYRINGELFKLVLSEQNYVLANPKN